MTNKETERKLRELQSATLTVANLLSAYNWFSAKAIHDMSKTLKKAVKDSNSHVVVFEKKVRKEKYLAMLNSSAIEHFYW